MNPQQELVSLLLVQESSIRRSALGWRVMFVAALLAVLWSLIWATVAVHNGNPWFFGLHVLLIAWNARGALKALDQLAESIRRANVVVEMRLLYEALA